MKSKIALTDVPGWKRCFGSIEGLSTRPNYFRPMTKKDSITMDRTACSVKGVLSNMVVQLQILDSEIKADVESRAEYQKQLAMLDAPKTDL